MENEEAPPDPIASGLDDYENVEYLSSYNNETIKFNLTKKNSIIIIRSSEYELKITPKKLSNLLNNSIYDSIDESFEFLKKAFSQNIIKISDIQPYHMTLKIQYDSKHEITLDLNKMTPEGTDIGPTPAGKEQQPKSKIFRTPNPDNFIVFSENFEIQKEILNN